MLPASCFQLGIKQSTVSVNLNYELARVCVRSAQTIVFWKM